jgi:hypothetical protein
MQGFIFLLLLHNKRIFFCLRAYLDRRVLGCISLHSGDSFSSLGCDPGSGYNTLQHRYIQTKPKVSSFHHNKYVL